MTVQERNRASKFLSKHLRHAPEAIGLELEMGGWVAIADLLTAIAQRGHPMTRADLDVIVKTNDKQRFAIDETGLKIRANQGHSVDVDLQLDPADPPAELYHGTAVTSLNDIMADGLKKMSRHHVHLSADIATATKVGARHGKPVVLVVAAGKMVARGHSFFLAANGVWLTDAVPPEFLTIATI